MFTISQCWQSRHFLIVCLDNIDETVTKIQIAKLWTLMHCQKSERVFSQQWAATKITRQAWEKVTKFSSFNYDGFGFVYKRLCFTTDWEPKHTIAMLLKRSVWFRPSHIRRGWNWTERWQNLQRLIKMVWFCLQIFMFHGRLRDQTHDRDVITRVKLQFCWSWPPVAKQARINSALIQAIALEPWRLKIVQSLMSF